MATLIRWARRLLGAACIAWGAWQLVRVPLQRSHLASPAATAVGAWGEPYELRVRPLSRDETRRAIEAERELYPAAWRDPGTAYMGPASPPLIIPPAPADDRPIGLEA